MALTSMRAPASPVLGKALDLRFSVGPYRYAIEKNGSIVHYRMHSAGEPLQAALVWAFGTGRVAQSYLFSAPDGSFREARVTYFSSLDNLEFTPARGFTTAASPEQAMYRDVKPAEVKLCFGCHTTASFHDDRLDEQQLFLGVTCEACHGPGARHASILQSAALAGVSFTGPSAIFNPTSLNPQDAIDFCGACHGTSWDVFLSGVHGVTNVRSEPYRLALSKCWGKGDTRLLCWRCHNPHEQLRSDPESYDHVCLSCHAGAPHTAGAGPQARPPCPVAKSACTSCHMPKVYVPDMHFSFADHNIRVVRPGEAYRE